jgi:hypothetical protein
MQRTSFRTNTTLATFGATTCLLIMLSACERERAAGADAHFDAPGAAAQHPTDIRGHSEPPALDTLAGYTLGSVVQDLNTFAQDRLLSVRCESDVAEEFCDASRRDSISVVLQFEAGKLVGASHGLGDEWKGELLSELLEAHARFGRPAFERRGSTYFAVWVNASRTAFRTLTCPDTVLARDCIVGIDTTTPEDFEVLLGGWRGRPSRFPSATNGVHL